LAPQQAFIATMQGASFAANAITVSRLARRRKTHRA
jgi:hypothetical protein